MQIFVQLEAVLRFESFHQMLDVGENRVIFRTLTNFCARIETKCYHIDVRLLLWPSG